MIFFIDFIKSFIKTVFNLKLLLFNFWNIFHNLKDTTFMIKIIDKRQSQLNVSENESFIKGVKDDFKETK